MSYSVCLECRRMVSAYEKYCGKCEEGKRSNPPDFWKTRDGSVLEEPKRSQEIAADTMTADEIAEAKQRVLNHHVLASIGANPRGNRAERRRAAAIERRRK